MRNKLLLAVAAVIASMAATAPAQYYHHRHHVMIASWRRDPGTWRSRVSDEEWTSFTTWRERHHYRGDWHRNFHAWIHFHPSWGDRR